MKAKRILSVFLAILMLISVVPVGTISVYAADVGTLEILDGKITKGELYQKFYEAYGEPYSSETYQGFYYTTSNLIFPGVTANVTSADDTGEVTLENATYNVFTGKKGTYLESSKKLGSFSSVVYYNPTVSATGVDGAVASLEAEKLNDGYKVYASSNTVTLNASIVDGYEAFLGETSLADNNGDGLYDTTVTVTSSENFEVKYVKLPEQNAVVNVTVNGNGTVEGVESGKEYGVTKTISFTAVPADDSYVSSISIGGVLQEVANERNTTVSYTITSADAVEIVVNFEKYEIATKDPISDVLFNPTSTISLMNYTAAENTAKALFEAVIPADSGIGFNIDNIKFKYNDAFVGFKSTYSLVYYNFNTNFAPQMRAGAAEEIVTVEITVPQNGKYPSLTIVADVKLIESRADCALSIAPISQTVKFITETEVEEAVKSAISNPNAVEYTLQIKEGSALPSDSNVETEVTYVVSFAGNSTYKPYSTEVTFKVMRLAKQCEVKVDASAVENGKVTVNEKENTESVLVDGKTDVTVSVAPNGEYAVKSLTVKDSNGKTVSSSVSYSNKTATVSFTSGDGETYTVYAEYVKTTLALKDGQEYEFCDKKTYNKTSLIKLVLDSDNSIPTGITAADCEVYYYCLDSENSTVEGILGAVGMSAWVTYGTELSSYAKYANAHNFGEKETELIKVVYSKESAVYGEVSAKTTIKIVDPCYNNTIAVSQEGNENNGSVSISSAEGLEKIQIGEKYIENAKLKVTVKPTDNAITLSSKAPYVKSVVVTDKAGNVVSSDVVYQSGSISTLYIPTASVEFTTKSNEEYTVSVVYAQSFFTVNEEEISFDMYQGIDGKYDSVYPSKKDIFDAVISAAAPEEFGTYDENTITVEYADDIANIIYKDAADILSAGDSTVKIKITRKGDGSKYQTITAEKNITLKDPRTATEIKYSAPTEAVEFVDDSALINALKDAMGFGVFANSEEIEDAQFDISIVSADEENNLVTVKVDYYGNESYKPSSVTIENIEVKDIPDNAEITVESENADVTIGGVKATDGKIVLRGESKYQIVAKPNSNYAIKEIIFESENGSAPLTLSYNSQTATAEIEVFEKKSYTVKVVCEKAEFVFKDNARYPFSYGYDTADENALYDAVVSAPQRADGAQIEIRYLAREKSTYTVEILGNVIEVPLAERWLELDAVIEETDNVYGADYGCHAFGSLGDGQTEKIKISYVDSKYKIPTTETQVTLYDDRIETVISSKDSAEVYYGFTAEELLNALEAKVTDVDGVQIEAQLSVEEDIALDASKDAYVLTLSYKGNKDYKPSKKTVSVIVNKAPVKISVPSQVIKYGESYDKLVATTDPANVSTIDFMAGLDVKDGAKPYIHLRLPGTLGELYKGEMSLNELKDKLYDAIKNNSDAIVDIGLDKETVDMLLDALEKIKDYADFGNTTIKINGSFAPENIGVYVIGSVTADSNYETEMAVGYLVVTPAATEIELAWAMDFEEGILTLPAVKAGNFDFDALAINDTLSNAELENAASMIKYTFTGVDKDGLALDSKTPIKLNGAYTQIAYIADWDNELFYAMPIMRAYVIAPEDVKVEFVGEYGEPNRDRVFTFDNNPHAMNAVCTDRQGNIIDTATTGTLSYKYVGADADVKGYNSTEPPVNAGAYTVTAVYTERDEDGDLIRAGMDIGAMVIKKTEIEISVDNKEKLCDEADPEFTYTVSGIEDESILGISLYREKGDAVGEYAISAKYNPSNFYNVTVKNAVLTISHNEAKYVVDEAVAAKCEETGLTEGAHCDGCGVVFTSQQTVDALGHDFTGDAVSNGDQTHSYMCKNGCQTVGVGSEKNKTVNCEFKECVLNADGDAHTQQCKECEYVRTNDVVEDKAVAPDCTNTGLKKGSHCAVCEKTVIAQETVAKLGHDFADGVVTAPNCTTQGYTTHTCQRENCGYVYYDNIVSKLGHDYETTVTEPTCTQAGYTTHTCQRDNCGYSYVDSVKNPNGHSFGEWFISTAATETTKGEKKRECANCDAYETCVLPEICHLWNNGELKKAASCSEEGTMLYTCTGCENCKAAGKNAQREVAIAKTAHTFVQNVVPATCTSKGSVTVVCKDCDYVASVVEISAKSHILKKESTQKATCTEYGKVTYKCENCDYKEETYIDKLPHEYTVDVSYQAPSNEKDGNKVLKCKHCDDTTTIVLPALKHNFVLVEEVNASCCENGYKVYECETCGYSYVTDKTNALGHSFTNYVSNDDATCTADGTKTAKCDRCDVTDTKVDSGSKKNHSIKTTVVLATCTNAGYTSHECETCDYAYVTDKTNALGHSFTNYVSNDDATCTADGTKTAKCDRCDVTDTKVDSGSKKNHSIKTTVVPATCTNAGYTSHECETCDYAYVTDKTNALGHSFTNYVSNDDATCTADGTKTAKCDRCDETDSKKDTGSALGHKAVKTKAVAPTCTKTGLTEGSSCERCAKVFVSQKVIPALGHKTKQVMTKATTKANGSIKNVCTVCNATVSTKTIYKVSSISLAKSSIAYSGKFQKPTVVVKDSSGKVLKNGTDYTVKCKAHKNIGKYSLEITLKGNYSGTKTLKYNIVPQAIQNLQVTNVKYNLKLTWTKVPKATGYRIYSYDAKTGKYTKVKDVKDNRYVITGLKQSKTYTYAVKAYRTIDGKKYFSELSDSVTSAIRTSQNKITSVKQGKGTSVTVKWTKAKYATKYAVYVCESKHGQYERVATVSGGDNTSVKLKGLKKGETYYIRVKSYRKVAGKNIYSHFSLSKKITIK